MSENANYKILPNQKVKNYIKYSYLCLMLSAFLCMVDPLAHLISTKSLFFQIMDPVSALKLTIHSSTFRAFLMFGIGFSAELTV